MIATSMTGLSALTDDDFPTGKRAPQHDHPKILRISELVTEHANEYNEADKLSEDRQYQGRSMRSKAELLTMIVDEIKPKNGHHYKKVERDGETWTINTAFGDRKLRTRVTNAFNNYLNARAVARRHAIVAGKTAYDSALLQTATTADTGHLETKYRLNVTNDSDDPLCTRSKSEIDSASSLLSLSLSKMK